MTAEIAVMNQEAVALAADSAVSLADSEYGEVTKIFTSANKLFALSQFHPVGIMIYGNTRLGEVPWETVIKLYRDQLGTEGKRKPLKTTHLISSALSMFKLASFR